jgi:Cys-tRNA(Pro) deacylase
VLQRAQDARIELPHHDGAVSQGLRQEGGVGTGRQWHVAATDAGAGDDAEAYVRTRHRVRAGALSGAGPLGVAACRGSIMTMTRKTKHVSETPATAWLRAHGVTFSEHPYEYVEHGGTEESSRQLGVPHHSVIKTLVMQDERAQPLIVLMHGDRQVSTKNLARAIGAKSVEPCSPEAAQRASGYQVGGTSPFGTRKRLPIYVEASVLELPRILINGGRRGYLVGLAPRVLTELLAAKPVRCARD